MFSQNNSNGKESTDLVCLWVSLQGLTQLPWDTVGYDYMNTVCEGWYMRNQVSIILKSAKFWIESSWFKTLIIHVYCLNEALNNYVLHLFNWFEELFELPSLFPKPEPH